MSNIAAHQSLLPTLQARELLSFEGAFSHDAVVEFMESLSYILGGEKPKKLFVVTIELIQNIKHYSAETLETAENTRVGAGIARVYDGGDMFITVVGNLIRHSEKERIESHCNKIIGLTHHELRALYSEQLKNAPPEGSKGAGLGFIDVAIKTGGQVDFNFIPLDNDYLFFTTTAFITKL